MPGPPPRLIFSFNCGDKPEYARQLAEEFGRHAILGELFSGIEVHFCDLPPEKDVYIRNSKVLGSPYGNKAGPNWLFYETMKRLRADCDFVLLMETDCQPIATHWLQRLEKLCSQNDDAWMIGSHYRGASPLHRTLARHINGNALYHIGDPAFWDFLDTILWPWMHRHIQEVDPDLAYDCAWETFLHRPEMENPGHYDWIVSREVIDRFRICNAIVNIAGYAEQHGDYLWTRRDVLQRYPGAVLVHGPLAPTAQHARSGIGLGKIRTDGGVKLSDREGEPVMLSHDGGIIRSLWLPGASFAPGMALRVSAGFEAPLRHGLRIEMRDCNGALLASSRSIRQPEKNAVWCTVAHAFAERHPFVRVAFRHHIAKDAEPVPAGEDALKITRGIFEISREGEVVARSRAIFG
jgi:hypothetical protein